MPIIDDDGTPLKRVKISGPAVDALNNRKEDTPVGNDEVFPIPAVGCCTMTQDRVSDEIVAMARKAGMVGSHPNFRAAIEAVAKRLRAEGMRKAAEMLVGWDTAKYAREHILARADAIDPPAQKEPTVR